jgi:hypothetical protein
MSASVKPAPTPADLEKLAADLVRKLGTQRARFLAALLDEAARGCARRSRA